MNKTGPKHYSIKEIFRELPVAIETTDDKICKLVDFIQEKITDEEIRPEKQTERIKSLILSYQESRLHELELISYYQDIINKESSPEDKASSIHSENT